ncbi:MAG TPA: hypothetical protein PLI12_03815, partial [Acetobacteraceae bacterium]|nr:hypothetical protein [Acetobacteraceae bacterium]
RHAPVWRSHDRFGHRIDEVEFHPAWHELMGLIRGSGYHALGWTAQRPGAQVARGIIAYLWSQGENGVCCPASMTFASLAALARSQGAVVALDDSAHPEFGSSVISFRDDWIAAHPGALRGFLAA